MAQVAAGFSDVFVSAGLPKDFIAQLNSATEAMVNALVDRQTTRGRVRGATTGLKNMLSEGRRIVSILDAFVKTALKDDRVLLDDWNSVKRIPKATGGAAAAPGTSSSVSTPAPDPVQAPTG